MDTLKYQVFPCQNFPRHALSHYQITDSDSGGGGGGGDGGGGFNSDQRRKKISK